MRRTQKELEEEVKYFKIYTKDNKWFGIRVCPACKEKIEHSANQKFILHRTLRNSLDLLCSSCNKKGERNHFFGKNHSIKTNAQISNNRKGKCVGSENSMANPEYRNRVSIALKEKYKSGDLDFLKEIQRKNALENQANGKLKTAPISSAEKELKIIFEDLGHKVISQFNIGSLKYDLFIEDKNILIEYNGDYWHCNPVKYHAEYFHKKKQLTAKQIWEHDARKKDIAEKKGYKLFIIWENDFMFYKENEINKIKNHL